MKFGKEEGTSKKQSYFFIRVDYFSLKGEGGRWDPLELIYLFERPLTLLDPTYILYAYLPGRLNDFDEFSVIL